MKKKHKLFKSQAKEQAKLFSAEKIVVKYESVYSDVVSSIRF